MKSSKNLFEMCKKTDHSVCYAMSRDTNPWFPHTIEELVVWIVERDTGELDLCFGLIRGYPGDVHKVGREGGGVGEEIRRCDV